jgi:ketosteroid isomerase-like protein
MADDEVTRNLEGMDELDFTGWNRADWHGVFARYHTDEVLVDVHGQPQTHGIEEHIAAMEAMVETSGGSPAQITSHPIRFGSGEWTCVVGEFQGGGRRCGHTALPGRPAADSRRGQRPVHRRLFTESRAQPP